MRWTSSIALGTGLLVSSCFPAHSESALRTRAAFDLNCPVEQIQIVRLSGNGYVQNRQYGVVGCSQRATYVESQSGYVLNADVQPAQ